MSTIKGFKLPKPFKDKPSVVLQYSKEPDSLYDFYTQKSGKLLNIDDDESGVVAYILKNIGTLSDKFAGNLEDLHQEDPSVDGAIFVVDFNIEKVEDAPVDPDYPLVKEFFKIVKIFKIINNKVEE